jgi:hypothetical protein
MTIPIEGEADGSDVQAGASIQRDPQQLRSATLGTGHVTRFQDLHHFLRGLEARPPSSRRSRRCAVRAVASRSASGRGAVIDIARPVSIRQTTPALVKERARMLRRPTRRVGGRGAGAGLIGRWSPRRRPPNRTCDFHRIRLSMSTSGGVGHSCSCAGREVPAAAADRRRAAARRYSPATSFHPVVLRAHWTPSPCGRLSRPPCCGSSAATSACRGWTR